MGKGRRVALIFGKETEKSLFLGGQILRNGHFSLFLAALWKLLKAQYLFIFCPFLKGEDWKGSHKITCFLRIFVYKGSAHSLLPLPKSLRHHSPPPFCSQQECTFARRGESWETEVWELHKNAGGGREEEEEGPLDWTKQLFGRGREGGRRQLAYLPKEWDSNCRRERRWGKKTKTIWKTDLEEFFPLSSKSPFCVPWMANLFPYANCEKS